MEPYMTPEEVGELLQFTPQAINRMARLGRIPAHAFGGGSTRRRWRFLRSELDAWQHSVNNASAHPCSEKETTL
jgi:excisionase family DNA binding protein